MEPSDCDEILLCKITVFCQRYRSTARVKQMGLHSRSEIVTVNGSPCACPPSPSNTYSAFYASWFNSVFYASKVHYRVHKSLPLMPLLSKTNPIHILLPCSFEIHFSITLQSVPEESRLIGVLTIGTKVHRFKPGQGDGF
jgi:hypothetical protein